MKVSRRPPTNVRLSGRERRALRRLEDATVAEDPLLDVRLGLVVSRSKRTVARLRRKAKAVGRHVSRRAATLVVGFVWCVLVVLTVASTRSIALPSLISVPCAFAIGVTVGRRRPLFALSTKDSSLPRLVQDSS